MIIISFEDRKITSIGRRDLDVNIHSSMPKGIVTENERRLYTWNCVCNEDASLSPRAITPFLVRRNNFPYTFE